MKFITNRTLYSKLFAILFYGILSVTANAAIPTDCPSGGIDISTPDELQNILKICANADTKNTTIKLVSDIDTRGLTLNQIHNFTGTFDGEDHTILLGDNGSYSVAPTPLFNALSNNAIVKNLHLNIHSWKTSTESVFGGVANIQMDNAKISRVFVFTDRIFVSGDIIGGLVGIQSGNGIIESSSFSGGFSAIGTIGGLVGTQDSAPVIRQSMANIQSGDMWGKTGGLVGAQYGINARIENSYATGFMMQGGGIAYQLSGKLVNSYSNVYLGSRPDLSGGLAVTIADNSEQSPCTDSYWNFAQVKSSAVCPNGGLSDAQMQNPDTYKSWDHNIWNIVPGQYPTLKWQR